MIDICPNCDAEIEFVKTIENEKIPYGIPPNQTMVKVVVPVYHCPACGFAYTDGEAEEIRDKATQHLRRIKWPQITAS